MSLINELENVVGSEHVLLGEQAAPFLTDWRNRYTGRAQAVVRPANASEVAEVVNICVRYQAPIVTQGGNTGLCGGATPSTRGDAVVVLLTRLNQVLNIDTNNDTITVQAGCILQSVQEAAAAAGRLFPLSLAAEGSCTIGGNLATNAGGTQVLRYGNARELTLGLEVVTADGEIWNGLRGLRKDNTGYDLRDLYIGSEGTLGIITAATLKLYPLPVARCTALLALNSIQDAVTVLNCARKGFGALLTGFELISDRCMNAVVTCFPQQKLPLATQTPWYALLEISDSESQEHARQLFETVVGKAIEEELVVDAVIAESIQQTKDLWHLRESVPLAEAEIGKAIKNDISLNISDIAEFVEKTNKLLQEHFPGVQHLIFGHLGDGNLHYNVGAPEGKEDGFLSLQKDIYRVIFDSVASFNGSISAEHGIGQLKKDILPDYKDEIELSLMRKIKRSLDPIGIMNPGKVISSVDSDY